MDRRHVILGLAATPLAACETFDPTILDGLGGLGGALTAGEVALGLKAALDNGVGNALTNVGVLNGFLTGALRLVDDVASQLKIVPFGPNLGAGARSDLIDHGVDYGLRGVFHFIGEEEKAIRENPAKRTSEILRRVFST